VAHVVADLSDTAAAQAAVERLAATVGPPDAVVTAAGTDACGPLAEVPAETWEKVVRVNLFGTAAVIRAALPHLEERHGTVVTVASTLGLRVAGDATAYCASKFAVVGFTRALTMELAGRVGVTLLVPGGMRTRFFDGRTEQYRPGPDALLNDPDDVAATVITALTQPPGCEIRELVVTQSTEPSWP
jgi:NAD(P)-dependent dehydrogenase (short-subunit alcohol dehydrogenase family)